LEKTLLKLKPSSWIIKQVEIVQKRKTINILDFASGGGRHSINLANNRRIITAIDKDRRKLELYKKNKNINLVCFDLERNYKLP
jgi:2-polyprenyl-3-methyl-5-hydroxy-6-metoxy-1,4-benzoquinol methylase